LTVRTLIVDDDVATRVGVRTILGSEPDIEVVGEADSAMEAVALAQEIAPDVVLMDIRLPDLDGIEATRRIVGAAANESSGPRVIVLTTFDVDEYAYQSMRAGASGFLLKRTPAEELVDAVRAVANGDTLPLPTRTRDLIRRFTSNTDSTGTERFHPPLTNREVEVLVLIARGHSNQEIADNLFLSLDTVKTHVKHIYTKCGARDRAHAVIAAYESGLVSRQGERPT
jgi:DNA-binding NarL/FixJ family response regulator